MPKTYNVLSSMHLSIACRKGEATDKHFETKDAAEMIILSKNIKAETASASKDAAKYITMIYRLSF